MVSKSTMGRPSVGPNYLLSTFGPTLFLFLLVNFNNSNALGLYEVTDRTGKKWYLVFSSALKLLIDSQILKSNDVSLIILKLHR